MRLIFGLGNPGPEYRESRHNLGFRVVENLSQKHKIELNSYSHQALIGKGSIGKEAVILAKPLTFVNAAGESLYQIKQSYRVNCKDIILISDDVDLDLGRLRIAGEGGDGGHKGLKSVIRSLGTNLIPRLRIGIGRPNEEVDLKEYVLGEFNAREKKVIEAAIDRASEGIETIISQGIDKAMNKYNSNDGQIEG
ncbi:MAG: aminoacyl-tRNA hydrolase [bacterium]